MSKKAQIPLVCHGHSRRVQEPIVELQFSPVTPDGYFLATASKDGQPMLRNGATGDWIGTFQGHKGAVWSCVLNDTALVAATASADFTARVWNAVTGDELHHAAFAHGAGTYRLVTGGAEKLLRLFDLARPDAAPALLDPAPDNVRTTNWIADNALLLVSYLNKPNVDVWDVRAGGPVRTLESKGPVTSVEVTEGGRYVVSADGGRVEVRDGTSFDLVKTLEVEDYEVESASYAPERGRLVAGGSDMWVHLYDFASGQELECSKGHHGPVHCVRFAPGATTYASDLVVLSERQDMVCKGLFVVLALGAALAAHAQAPPPNALTATATLTGQDEVPPRNSPAGGSWTGTIVGNSCSWSMNVTSITDLIMAHLHQAGSPRRCRAAAPAGKEGPVVVTLLPLPSQPSTVKGGLAQLDTPISGDQNFSGSFTPANFEGALAGKGMNDLLDVIRAGNIYVNMHTTANPGGEIRGQVSLS
eukprot:scaffold7.g3732.t1